MKYRIIEKSMHSETGLLSYRGYTRLYFIERKGWFGWKIMHSTLSITKEQIDEFLQLAEQGKLNKKGDRLYENN